MKKTGFNIAYCGIICALVEIVMFAAIIPATTYTMPAVAGLLIWSVSGQINRKWAVMTYIASAALSLILVPEIESKVFLILLFGYYPLLRESIHKIKFGVLRFLVKLVVFNAAAVTAYMSLVYIFGVGNVLEGMESFGEYALYAFWIIGNATFFFYDFSLKYMMFAYYRWLKPVLRKKIK